MRIFLRILSGIFITAMLFISSTGLSQDHVVIDEVVGVVGDNHILESELYEQKRQYEAQGEPLGSNPYCTILEDMLFQKLLYNQAMIDSVEVRESQIEQEIERRLRFFIQQIGSRERLEEYYGMSVGELREEFWDPIREQLISQRMESQITSHVSVTPSEVKDFFHNLPEDDIPMVDSEMTLAKIQIEPDIAHDEIEEVKERLEGFRQRVLEGESFRTLAIMYSDDTSTAREGGELGFMSRDELHPELEAAAFSLSSGEVSEVVETPSGFHIVELIERRGENVNIRHILLAPQVSPQVEQETKNKLDSLRTLVMSGEMSFDEAAREFSDHRTGPTGGRMTNPYTGTNRFRSDHIDPNLFFVVDRLEVGEISRPIETFTDQGRMAYKIVTVQNRVEPHQANLQQDYDFIQELAREQKREKAIKEWVKKRLESTYVSIHDKYKDCQFDIDWQQ